MTSRSDFKARVRARMAKTGERYAAARAVLLAQAGTPPEQMPAASPAHRIPLLPGYDRVGGIHAETASMANVLRQAGVAAPHTGRPYDEALLFGLAGGIGFMYFAFEYAGHPPTVALVLRSDSYPDAFVRRGLERVGARVAWHETGSARAAARALDEALDAGRAALVQVDQSRLPWYGVDPVMGYGPRFVAVCGRDDATLAIDDRAPVPLHLTAEELAAARAAFPKGRHALATVEGAEGPADLPGTVLGALAETARGIHEPPYRGYASNFGLRGLEKWRRLIEDRQDPKGWPRLLESDADLAMALGRVVEGVELDFTPPAGGRRLYADFLDEAAVITGRDGLRRAADAYRAAADRWSAVARAALPEDVPELGAISRSLEESVARIDELGAEAAEPNRAARAERQALAASLTLEPAQRSRLLADLAARVDDVIRAERAALAELEAAVR